MEYLRILGDGLSMGELVKGAGIALLLRQLLPSSSATRFAGLTKSTEIVFTGGFFCLFLLARAWLALVDHKVPEPYLVRFPVSRTPETQTNGRPG